MLANVLRVFEQGQPSFYMIFLWRILNQLEGYFLIVSQAPPVGSYDVKNQTKGSAAAGFGKGKRFAELKGNSYILCRRTINSKTS